MAVTSTSKTVRWPTDSTCIEVDQPDEVKFWSRWFRVSAGMLRQAVRVVGCHFKDVMSYLIRKRAG